ncbi:hypothetical protein [Thioclava kandeliae]|uniref:O-antigen ligase domain-containing protein n=1 Tax=Thioclava kandeliae TaxID=3070818 RepID=A0ABV1SMA6_9RHOB
MPNTLATFVLFSWPLVTWLLFKKYRVSIALPATIIFGYLFIPERISFDPPLLPAIDKSFMPSLCTILFLAAHNSRLKRVSIKRAQKSNVNRSVKDRTERTSPGSRVARLVPLILLLMLCAPVLTWLTNQNALIYGSRYLKGIALYDMLSMVQNLAVIFLPFWLARRELGTPQAANDLLKVFAIASLIYSVLVMWEARMSPQLNRDLYGFFASDWRQHVREGFRPIVFLAHGLRVGIFICMGALACAALARANIDGRRSRWLLATAWMIVVLYFSRNLGAMLICLPLTAVILVAPLKIQFLLAGLTSITVLLYPMARGSGAIPTERITDYVALISPERAASFEYRLRNEDILLEKANEKPLTGWGGFGRSRVFDPITGADQSTTDGSWVISIGVYGWVGYLGQFGLLCGGAILMWLRHRRYGLNTLDSGIALILVANLVDLIPNSSLVPILWLMAGATWSRSEYGARHPATFLSPRTRTRTRTRTSLSKNQVSSPQIPID